MIFITAGRRVPKIAAVPKIKELKTKIVVPKIKELRKIGLTRENIIFLS